MQRNDNAGDFSVGAVLMSGFKGMIVGIISTLVLAAVFTGVSLAFGEPRRVADLLSYAALVLTALGVGISAVRFDREHRLTSALVGGCMYALLMLAASLFIGTDGEAGAMLLKLGVWAAFVGVCMLGGAMGKGRRVRVGEGNNSPTALARRRLAARK